MRYILYFLANLVFDLVAYLISWAVPIFADKNGYVPAWLSWFTTWDAPSLDRGDEWNKEKWPLIYNSSLPAWAKRYCYRVAWLYRNTGYGFAYDVVGAMVSWQTKVKGDLSISNLVPAKSGWLFAWDTTKSLWTRPWVFYLVYQYGKSNRCLRIYLGWKMIGLVKNKDCGRVMLASFVHPYFYYDGGTAQ